MNTKSDERKYVCAIIHGTQEKEEEKEKTKSELDDVTHTHKTTST